MTAVPPAQYFTKAFSNLAVMTTKFKLQHQPILFHLLPYSHPTVDLKMDIEVADGCELPFNYLMLTDSLSVGQTGKRLNQVFGFVFHSIISK